MDLAIGTIGIGVFIPLVVGALKLVGLVKDGDAARKANLYVGLVFGALWLAVYFFPEILPYVEAVLIALLGSLIGAGIYQVKERLTN